MADYGKWELLSIGAFLVIIVIGILLYQPLGVVKDWSLILPFVIAACGCWVIVLAGMRYQVPQKYVRGPFSTFSWGLLLIAVGGAWLLYAYGFWIYSAVLILLVLAVLAITTALKK